MGKATTIRDRYPPPWRALETDGGWCVVSANKVAVAFIYAIDNEQQRASAYSSRGDAIFCYVTQPEAKAIAHAIAALPELIDVVLSASKAIASLAESTRRK